MHTCNYDCSRSYHQVTGYDTRGLSSFFARAVTPDRVDAVIAEAIAAGWTDVRGYVETF